MGNTRTETESMEDMEEQGWGRRIVPVGEWQFPKGK
jgi:hypothetical protein